jgi:hypothetical protein
MPWDAMAGNQQVRHCGECKLNVYNLSAMTEIEIQRLLVMQPAEQRVCVRFYRRADGTMLTQDCPRGIKRLAKRVSKLGAAVFSALVSMNLRDGEDHHGWNRHSWIKDAATSLPTRASAGTISQYSGCCC